MARLASLFMGHREELRALAEIEPAFGRAMQHWGEPPSLHAPQPLDRGGRFAVLARTIVGQRFSVASATAIHGRVLDLVGGALSPEAYLEQSEEALRAAGLSLGKYVALRELSLALAGGVVDLEALDDQGDEEAIDSLVQLPGIGPWTAHTFLMLALRRTDILATGDVAVRNGIRAVFDLPERPSERELAQMAKPWRPHRSAACFVAWHGHRAAPLRFDEDGVLVR